MKKKIGFGLLCVIILLSLSGCGDKTFTLSYTTKGSPNIIYENNTIILPTNSKCLEEQDLKRYFKFYDNETGEEVEDISYDVNFSNKEVGTYDLNITGKYDNKVGNTTIKIQYVESCSGECVINTTNWTFKLSGDTEYGEYSPNYILKVKLAMSPKESAFEFSTRTEKYENINDGFIKLYYENFSTYDKQMASNYNYDDNALNQYYSLNQSKDNMYIQFTEIPKLNGSEAFIDFYDNSTKEHHFYYVN